MKKLLIVLATLAFIAGVGVMKAEAATDTIVVTVTMQNISVTVTPATWDLSTIPIAPGSTNNTQACTATNDGNVNENLDIAVGNSTNWTAGPTAGTEIFAMDFQLPAGSWTNITNAGVDLKNNLAPGAQDFTLRFSAPSLGSVYTQQSITVTVSAAAAA